MNGAALSRHDPGLSEGRTATPPQAGLLAGWVGIPVGHGVSSVWSPRRGSTSIALRPRATPKPRRCCFPRFHSGRAAAAASLR